MLRRKSENYLIKRIEQLEAENQRFQDVMYDNYDEHVKAAAFDYVNRVLKLKLRATDNNTFELYSSTLNKSIVVHGDIALIIEKGLNATNHAIIWED